MVRLLMKLTEGTFGEPMLKAWLHRKLRRPVGDADLTEPEGSAEERIFAREDPLTSAVFERLAYLEPAEAWALLREAHDEHDREQIPVVAPSETPEWSFWPGLSPGTLIHARFKRGSRSAW